MAVKKKSSKKSVRLKARAKAEQLKPARGTQARKRKKPAKVKHVPSDAARAKAARTNNPGFFAHSIQIGEVRNPRGLNQYTYRRDAEQTFARILQSARGDKRKGTVSEEILEIIMTMAQNKDRWALERVLERILPKIEKHIHEDEPDADRLASELAALIARG